MKILWLYQYMAGYDFDNNLHLKYVQWMRDNGYDVTCYGPKIEQKYPELVDLKFDRKLTWPEIVNKTKADVAIVMTKSRMWEYYNPHTNRYSGYWLPKDFNNTMIPKLCAEEDYMYEKNDDWYAEVGIDLMLHRHSCNAMRNGQHGKVPSVWAPFSVDEKCFYDRGESRVRSIVRCGSASPLYPTRMDATQRLKKHNLIDVKSLHDKEDAQPFMAEREYMECLNRYQAALVGVVAGGYPITPAKVFEIMACGTVLLHDPIPGSEYIFPADSTVEFKPYTDDVVDCATWINASPTTVRIMGERLAATAKKAHTHKVRTDQLIELIENRIWNLPLEWNTLVKEYRL